MPPNRWSSDAALATEPLLRQTLRTTTLLPKRRNAAEPPDAVHAAAPAVRPMLCMPPHCRARRRAHHRCPAQHGRTPPSRTPPLPRPTPRTPPSLRTTAAPPNAAHTTVAAHASCLPPRDLAGSTLQAGSSSIARLRRSALPNPAAALLNSGLLHRFVAGTSAKESFAPVPATNRCKRPLLLNCPRPSFFPHSREEILDAGRLPNLCTPCRRRPPPARAVARRRPPSALSPAPRPRRRPPPPARCRPPRPRRALLLLFILHTAPRRTAPLPLLRVAACAPPRLRRPAPPSAPSAAARPRGYSNTWVSNVSILFVMDTLEMCSR
nr:uncharacterized protein LOC127347684 [Lolium perenne]